MIGKAEGSHVSVLPTRAMAKNSPPPPAADTVEAMPRFDIYAGLSGLELTPDTFDLGEGVTVSRTYAHLMAPFMMAFKEPVEHGQHHPGPWKSLGGGIAYDIEAEIRVPRDARQPHAVVGAFGVARSEERRVGKECRSRWSPYH